MNVSRNSEVRPCNYCCSVQAMIITKPECIVALGIQLAMRMLHIVIGGLPRSTIFFPHYLINGTILERKKLLNVKCV